MSYTIRPAAEADLNARGLVHCAAWQETYRGLMPDAILDSMTPERSAAAARKDPLDTLLLLRDDQAVGFACCAAEARDFTGRPGCSEIAALYLLRTAQGQGWGRKLMEAALERLPHQDVILYVQRENRRAIGFYEHMGFAPTGRTLFQETEYGALEELEMLLRRREGL